MAVRRWRAGRDACAGGRPRRQSERGPSQRLAKGGGLAQRGRCERRAVDRLTTSPASPTGMVGAQRGRGEGGGEGNGGREVSRGARRRESRRLMEGAALGGAVRCPVSEGRLLPNAAGSRARATGTRHRITPAQALPRPTLARPTGAKRPSKGLSPRQGQRPTGRTWTVASTLHSSRADLPICVDHRASLPTPGCSPYGIGGSVGWLTIHPCTYYGSLPSS